MLVSGEQSRGSRRAPLWVALGLLFVVSLPAVTVRFYASDEIEYFAYVRSIWFDRDLSFDNEYRYFYDVGIARAHLFKETFLDYATPTGLRRNFAPIGSALLWAPMYVAADAGVRTARAFGSDIPADGFSRPYIAAVAYGSAVYGFLAIVLSAAAARRVSGSRSMATVAAVWLGTPLLFYMYVAPGFSHACSAFAVAAFVVVWLRVRDTWSVGGVAALGALAALMAMVREQDAFIAAGPAIDFLSWSVRSVRRGQRPGIVLVRAAIAIAVFTICFLPQAMSYLTLYGHVGPSPDVRQKMTWTSPNAWRVLLSPENGWLFWTPLAAPALIGLWWLAVSSRNEAGGHAPSDRAWIASMCLVMVATQLYVSGSLDTWAGAGSFGQRRLVGLTVFLVIGLAGAFQAVRSGWPRYLLQGLVLVCLWWNVGLTAQFGMGMMDRRRLHPAENAYNNFVTIPREFPALVYRYAFDRRSFYRTATPSSP